MPTKREDEPEEIGKPHPTSDGAKPGTERARDEQRAGMNRGETPQKPKPRTKANPGTEHSKR